MTTKNHNCITKMCLAEAWARTEAWARAEAWANTIEEQQFTIHRFNNSSNVNVAISRVNKRKIKLIEETTIKITKTALFFYPYHKVNKY